MRRSAEGKKAELWRVRIREAAQSGLSVRQFCRRRKLRECQFYWWQRKLKETRPAPASGTRASFALVSEEAGAADAGLELVLGDGRRLRIRRGVDEETLRAKSRSTWATTRPAILRAPDEQLRRIARSGRVRDRPKRPLRN